MAPLHVETSRRAAPRHRRRAGLRTVQAPSYPDGLSAADVESPMNPKTRTPMSDEHKTALAEGRDQGRTVRRYLEALEANKPRRGRRRSPEVVTKRLAAIETDLP